MPIVVVTTLICATVDYGEEGPVLPAPVLSIDGTLYTSWIIDTAHTNITWIVCDSTQNTEGCYSSGSIGPFGKVGGLLGGNPKQDLVGE